MNCSAPSRGPWRWGASCSSPPSACRSSPAAAAGWGAFLGPSGGALFAWALTPLAVGGLLKVDWLCQRAWREWLVLVVVGVLGINLAEVAWLTFGYHFAFTKALLAESLFLPGDLIKATLSVTVARRLRAIFGKGW